MTTLVISEKEQVQINAAIDRALKHPIPLALVERVGMNERNVLTLTDRQAHPEFIRPESEHVYLPMGFRCSLSYEHQPSGLFRHLSVSVAVPGRLPNQPAMEMIAKAFGFRLSGPGTSWLEEFAPGHMAINIVEMVDAGERGRS